MPGDGDLLSAARAALLDALEALGPHADNVVVIGAQAIYLHTGDLDLAIAEMTKDADVALDTRGLAEDPLIEDALRRANFYRNPATQQPGSWCAPSGLPVDVMVPEALAGPGAKNRRGARLPPHAKDSMRRAVGLEACVVDSSEVEIRALDPNDQRVRRARVAGPAGLLVAKLHKVGERVLDGGGRLQAKDAHDIYRILVARDTDELAARFAMLLTDEVAADVTAAALAYLREYFSHPDGRGALLAGTAEEGVGDPDQVAESVAALVTDLLDHIG